jgi:uncharacterized protein YcnI
MLKYKLPILLASNLVANTNAENAHNTLSNESYKIGSALAIIWSVPIGKKGPNDHLVQVYPIPTKPNPISGTCLATIDRFLLAVFTATLF